MLGKSSKFLFIFSAFFITLSLGDVSPFSTRRLKRDSGSDTKWEGKWFPHPPMKSEPTSLPTLFPGREMPLNQGNSMWTMVNQYCDDGQTNLTVDWDESPINYTCFHPKRRFEPQTDLQALIIKEAIPMAYRAMHVCMDEKIAYDSPIPTFGPHRPAWPVYGEYVFLPRERWLHSLEHGAIVMLYHPCAHPILVGKLREIVQNCLRRHIISPYNLLPEQRPLALLSWGWTYLMPDVDEEEVINFIKEHSLRGPEQISKDGVFNHFLKKEAKIVSDFDDSKLCPTY